MIYAFLFAEDVIAPSTQMWAVIALFATLVAYLIRSEYNRFRDKRAEADVLVTRALERKDEKQERLDAENRARREREEIANKIKAENREVEEKVCKELERNAAIIKQQLELHYEREKLELEKNAFKVVTKLGEQEQVVKTIDKKIVTLVKADEHKNELKEAIAESTVAAKDAFEVANTINLKLEKMSKSGLLNQEQEIERKEIDEIETENAAEEVKTNKE